MAAIADGFVDPFFADNWTYLRAEMAWLDRLLASAIARQKKTLKTVERSARTKADQATSHWWQGLVQLDTPIGHDSPAKPSNAKPPLPFQQQLDMRVNASREAGVMLALPTLGDRLGLTLFDKQVLVLALAPEISRRYGRMYNFLQEREQGSGQPSVDLVLRLLCRNDQDWRSNRQRLTGPLHQRHLLDLLASQPGTSLLNRTLHLSDRLVNYLLADRPSLEQLEALLNEPEQDLLHSTPLSLMDQGLGERLEDGLDDGLEDELDCAGDRSIPPKRLISNCQTPNLQTPVLETSNLETPDLWQQLVLPRPLYQQLRHLGDRLSYADQVDAHWRGPSVRPGNHCLFIGPSGTGKTFAARALAQSLGQALVSLDLGQLSPAEDFQVIDRLIGPLESPRVLLIHSAHHWLGPEARLLSAQFNRLLAHRSSLVIWSDRRLESLQPSRYERLNWKFEFLPPTALAREQLWRQAFPASVQCSKTLPWAKLAQRYELTGGEIGQIAWEAQCYAQAEGKSKILLRHIESALRFYQTCHIPQ
jgi:ATPase family associated with various cellular activities (AAA)